MNKSIKLICKVCRQFYITIQVNFEADLRSVKFDRFIHLLENNIETISCSCSVYRQFYIFLSIWLFETSTVEIAQASWKTIYWQVQDCGNKEVLQLSLRAYL